MDAKGHVNSLTSELGQEVDRFNSLLKVIKVIAVRVILSCLIVRHCEPSSLYVMCEDGTREKSLSDQSVLY